MKQDYSDKILKEYEKNPIRCQKWADRRCFYLQYIWPLLHPVQNYQLKKIMTPTDEALNRLHKAIKHKELMQKYEHLTQEQVDLIWQKVFDDNDNNNTDS